MGEVFQSKAARLAASLAAPLARTGQKLMRLQYSDARAAAIGRIKDYFLRGYGLSALHGCDPPSVLV
jgi:hypothetical protein